jgi:hypothetical protein
MNKRSGAFMQKRSLKKSVQIWMLSLLLSWLTYNKYYEKAKGVRNEFTDELLLTIYFLFFILIYLMIRQFNFTIKEKVHGIFILLIIIFNWILVWKFQLSEYDYILKQSFNYFYVFMVSLFGFALVKSNVISEILIRYYFIAFISGLSFLATTEWEIIDRNVILNENTWGFFLAPFLIYLYIIQKGLLKKLIIYLLGILLIYFTNANTALFTFVLLPGFIFVFNRVGRPRLLYTIILLVAIFSTYLIAQLNSGLITTLLSYRNQLWGFYLENATVSIYDIFFGVGRWTIIDKGIPHLYRLGGHNTFVSLFHFNGIVALILYILFIIFGMRKRSTKFTVSDGIIYLSITFQFAESNIPLFSFIFPAFIFMANMLINKESEEAERKLEIHNL